MNRPANAKVFLGRDTMHDWYRNPRTGAAQPVPRHREINDHLARHILNKLSD
jgi:hypothetical protein